MRRGHPFDGMELRVAKRFRTADGALRVRVEHPGGGSLTVPATWTHLEAPKSEEPLTRGRVRDYVALGKLLEDLDRRLEQERADGSGVRIAAGNDRLAGVPHALEERAGERPGKGGGGSGGDAGAGGGGRA